MCNHTIIVLIPAHFVPYRHWSYVLHRIEWKAFLYMEFLLSSLSSFRAYMHLHTYPSSTLTHMTTNSSLIQIRLPLHKTLCLLNFMRRTSATEERDGVGEDTSCYDFTSFQSCPACDIRSGKKLHFLRISMTRDRGGPCIVWSH